jgi:general secretion pathway protein I
MTRAAPGLMPRPDHAAGFTLIEVLVALAVLAAVLSSALGVFSTGLRGLSRSDERLTLALFAESLLTRSGLDLARGADGEASGSTADGLSWRVRRVPFQLPKAEVDAAVEEAVLPPSERERDVSSSSSPPRFGRDADADAEAAEGEGRQQEERDGTGEAGTAEGQGGSEGGGTSGFGSRRSSAGGGDGAGGAQTRPSLRLWQVQVSVQNARGESFALTTLHVDRAR